MKTGWLLRLEGIAILALSLVLFSHFEGRWWVYAVFFLAPDLSALGYLINKQVGAISYNAAHNLVTIATLGFLCYFLDLRWLLIAGLIMLGHVGADRVFGYGLKYQVEFKETHLQRV